MGTIDPALGANPFNKLEVCQTCGQDSTYCLGHPGHVELSVPVYNPMNMAFLYRLLKAKCYHCH